MKYCSQEMQPPQTRVMRSSKDRSELAKALRIGLYSESTRVCGHRLCQSAIAVKKLLYGPKGRMVQVL